MEGHLIIDTIESVGIPSERIAPAGSHSDVELLGPFRARHNNII